MNTIATAVPRKWVGTDIWSPRAVAMIMGAYFVLHAVTRLLMGPVLGIDDAEQTLFAQHLNWGYRFAQPPLFTWIYVGLGNAIGFGIVAATIMRYALLGLTAFFLYSTARRLIPDRRLAALALFSFGLIYVFAVYSHHDLTHTTTLAATIAATLYVVCRLTESPRWRWYAALGICVGLGVLAKWNYVMLPAALFLAAVARRETRELVLTPKLAAVLLPAAAILAGPLVWVFSHIDSFASVQSSVLSEGGAPPTFLQTLASGTADFLVALAAFPQPLLVIFAAVFLPGLWFLRHGRRDASPRPASHPRGAWDRRHRLLLSTIVAGIILHWALVPVLGAVSFNERWMHPVLMPAPLLAFAALACRPPTDRAVRIFIAILVGVTALAWTGLVVRHLLGADACGSCRTLTPIPELAEQIADETAFDNGTIVTSGFHLGGNLRVAFPGARVIETGYPDAVWPPSTGADGQCLAVWTVSPGSDASAPRVPEAIMNRLGVSLGISAAQSPQHHGTVETLMHGSETRRYALGYALFDNEEATC
ncbi:glycosyltransferase family 39 protein [Fodinicurvata sp. EGI_FJ10296]|uniref:ArnT family glycosyltransferase n=1 Tax=Fodinicurvata sp. EGI_FJ10296 TaxID=3231908 RepID=UPI003452A6E9